MKLLLLKNSVFTKENAKEIATLLSDDYRVTTASIKKTVECIKI